MKLAYTAYDSTGQEVTATIDAPNAANATETLRRKGMFVSTIGEQTGEAAAPTAPTCKVRSKSKRLKYLSGFMRQLHVLVSCGTPLVEALKALERQAIKDERWRQILMDVRSRVEEGVPLSSAMNTHPDVFDSVCQSLIAAGESTGDLPAMLDWLAITSRKQLRVRNVVTGAMMYPALLLCITVSVLALVLLFVIPRFGDLFKTLDVPLPPTTSVLINTSAFLQSYWWAIGLLVGGTTVALMVWTSRPAGRRMLDTLVLRLPQFGRLVRNFITARIARLLGGLLQGHVSVLEALELTQKSVKNCHYVELIDRAREAVTQGQPLSTAFKDTDLISPSVYEAVRNGEASGQIAPLLLNLSDFLDEDNEVVIRSLTSIIEPIILVGMGLLVGTVALGMFMPLFDLTSMT